MRIRAVVTVAAALLAAGCAGAGESASPRETTAVHSVRGATEASAIPVPPAVSPAPISPSAAFPAPVSPSRVSPAPSVATGAPPTAPGSLPRITVRRTGGFAGVEQTLVVRPDGQWAWGGADAGGAPRGGRLTAAQRRELARLAGLPVLAAEARQKARPPQCADGFAYRLTVGSLTVSWVDCDRVTPPTAVAITDLLAAATPL